MKNLLFILLLFSGLTSVAQRTQIVQGAASSGSVALVASTTTALQSATRSGKTTAIVTDTISGGPFNYSSATLTDNGGTIFAASGGGHWVRDMSQSKSINLKWFGAIGDGVTYDSAAVKAWFLYCVNSRREGYVPAGVYNVTSVNGCIKTIGTGVQVVGITMRGEGQYLSKFYVTGDFTGHSIIDFTNIKSFDISDIGFEIASNSATGTAIKLVHAVSSVFRNIHVYGFAVGMDISQNYATTMEKVQVYYSDTCMKLLGNSFNIRDVDIANALSYGVFINSTSPGGFYPGASVRFSGGLMQGCAVGIKIKAGDISLDNFYFEANAGGNLLAGVDVSDDVSNVTIQNCEVYFAQKTTIDRVRRFTFKPKNARGFKNLEITANCQFVDMPPHSYNFNEVNPDHEFMPDQSRVRQTSFPHWFYDFRDIDIPSFISTATNIDRAGKIVLTVARGTYKDTTDALSGGKALLFRGTPGVALSGLFFKIDSAALPKTDYATFVWSFKMAAADTNGYIAQVQMNYRDTGNVARIYTGYVYGPTVPSYITVLGRWVTNQIPINIAAFKTAVGAAFGVLVSVNVNFYYTSSIGAGTNQGNESIIVDNIGLYPAMYSNTVYTDNMFSWQRAYMSNPRYLYSDYGTFSNKSGYLTGQTFSVADSNMFVSKSYVNSQWVISTGKFGTLTNNLTLSGTDGTVQTFPSTSATIARTDAQQSFTGTQTFLGAIGNSGVGIFPALASTNSFYHRGNIATGMSFVPNDITTSNILRNTLRFGETWTPDAGSNGLNVMDFGLVKIDQSSGNTGIVRIINGLPDITSAFDIRFLDIRMASGWAIHQSSSTALNHFNGKMLLGTTTNDGVNQLQITGNTRMTGALGINTTVDASASLDISSTTKGALIPRVTNTQMNAISSPATGLLVWNTTDSSLYDYRGVTGWNKYFHNSGYQDLLFNTDNTNTIGGTSTNRPSTINAATSVNSPKFQTATGVQWTSGTGSPEGVVTANVGSTYTRTDGAAGTTLYIKETGSGNTGWSATSTTALTTAILNNEYLNIYAALGGSVKAEPPMGGIMNLTTTAALTSGVMKIMAVYLPNAATITGIKFVQNTAFSGTANNYNGVGLYTYSGGTITLVASSTDDATIWSSTGLITKAFSSTYSASAGVYFLAALWNASATTTAPVISAYPATVAASLSSMDFTNSAKISGTISKTSLPSTQALSAVSASSTNVYLSLY